MPRYSFIVPVYNTEKYLSKCLDSLVKQTFNDYEIIIVNDGTKDNSQDIIDGYAKKHNKIKAYKKSNGGLSDARNYGVKKATGDYLIFVDSDDYVAKNMLKEINTIVDNNDMVDIVKFNYANVVGETVTPVCHNFSFKNVKGEEAIINLVNFNNAFEAAWLYAYSRKYWLTNKFSYALGKYHEDFGLTPLVIMKAQHVFSINSVLYYYVRHDNSITLNSSYDKTVKKAFDMLSHFDYLLEEVNKDKKIDINTKKIFNSFLANAVIIKTKDLNGNGKKEYMNELKKRNVVTLVLNNNLKRLLKKTILRLNINWYLKLK